LPGIKQLQEDNMADDRYGGYGRRDGWRERDSSIFSDDDDRGERGSGRWSSDRGRERVGDDDRGFFERAGDEVRSWFGDGDAEHRRERDVRRDEARGAFGGRDEDRRSEGGRSGTSGLPGGYGFSSQSGSDWERGGRERAGWGSGVGGSTSFGGGRSQWDDNYRRWRDQQIGQLDREYDEYCRERQQQFEQDFDSWRTSRLTEGGPSGDATAQTGGGSATGFAGEPSRGQPGTGPAAGSSAGGTGPASETAGKVGTGETEGGGRGRRSRS
jgi:hypothetical protein